MELTHNYTRQAAFSRLRSSLKQHVVQFVNQNPEVFEALCRSGAPFGGNCLPNREQTTGLTTTQPTQQELALVQQQLDELAEQVAQLTNKLSALQSTPQGRLLNGSRKPSAASGKQIGIYRFWALQGKKQTMA